MDHHDTFRLRVLVPLLLISVLALPAWAAPSGKTSHYPGQKCDKCHDVPRKPGEKAPAAPAPAGGGATGSAGTQTGTTPSKGGAPAR